MTSELSRWFPLIALFFPFPQVLLQLQLRNRRRIISLYLVACGPFGPPIRAWRDSFGPPRRSTLFRCPVSGVPDRHIFLS